MIYLIVMTLLNIAATAGVHLAIHRTRFGQLEERKRQILIGLLYGLLACAATEFGSVQYGSVTNIRDAMPMTAGLLFGGQAGILAGFIGGVHRWFAAYWGGGFYTRVACSVSTIIAGYAAALMRKYFFRDTWPSLYYVSVFSVSMEAFHMLMIFLTHVNDLKQAFLVIRANTLQMIAGNGAALILAVLAVWMVDIRLGRQSIPGRFDTEKPAVPRALVLGLLAASTLAFVSVGFFVFFLQTRLSELNIEEALRTSTQEVSTYIEEEGYSGLEEDGQEMLQGLQRYHVHLFSKGKLFLVDASGQVFHPAAYQGTPERFELEGCEPKTLYHTRFGDIPIYYMMLPVQDFFVVAAIPVADTMIFRDITIYLLSFMIILLFSIMFFGSYVFVRQNITENIRHVSTAMMQLLDPEAELQELQEQQKSFVSISGEINHSIATLNHYYGGIMNQMEEEQGDLKKFRYQAEHDGLTGLWNRNGFERKLSNLEGLSINVAFLFVDVDFFKEINDQNGHEVGDLILKKVAEELKSNIRQVDLAVRLGGDEFALLMVGCSLAERETLRRKVEDLNRRLQYPEDGLPPVSLSVGVAFSDQGYNDSVVQNADAALYRAKAAGRARCCFHGYE